MKKNLYGLLLKSEACLNKVVCFCFVFSCLTFAVLDAQEIQPDRPVYQKISGIQDPVALIGMSLTEMLEAFGPPVSVYALRGAEEWQDDVVFEYKGMDFYLYKDRVWQVSPLSIYNISVGDPKMAVTLSWGDKAADKDSYMIYEVPGKAWKIELRYNIDAKGKISAIYIYRADY
ncbi:MAG: hypothetical protein LBV68_06815 [Spirochaetaceae bacterium]|jgi:hypothetical protein|nr:hypothetical protein [Spirochaetaceae bacterium]